jgi:hypothetical protein
MEVEGTGRRSSRSSEQSLEAWAGLEDRMATKLAQLMRLLQHFNDVSNHDAQSENSDEVLPATSYLFPLCIEPVEDPEKSLVPEARCYVGDECNA